MSVIAPILALLLLSPQASGRPPGQGAPQRVRSPSAVLERVEMELVVALARRRPWLARQLGLHPTDQRRLELDAKAALAWRHALQRAANALAAIPPEKLAGGRRLDLEWMKAWVRAESLAERAFPGERWNPAWHLEEIEAVLRGLAEAPDLANVQRATLVGRHLGELPDALLSARETLSFPAPPFCEHGAVVASELGFFLGDELDGWIRPDTLPWDTLQGFEEDRRGAVAATRAFGSWLRVRAEGDGRPHVMGKTSWIATVQAITGTTATTRQIKARLLGDIADFDLMLAEADIPPVPPFESLHEKNTRRRMLNALRQGRALSIGAGWSSKGAPEVDCRVRSALVRPGPVARLRGGAAPVLELEYRASGWPRGLRAFRARWVGKASSRALALRHGYPGEAAWREWSRKSGSVAQRTLGNRALREGWGLFAAEHAPKIPGKNAFAGDAALVGAIRWQRMVEAARLLASLELHAEGRAEAEVSARLVGIAGIDPDTARTEVRLSLVDPLRGVGYLGYRELETLSKDVERDLPAAMAWRWIAQRMSRHPSSRPSDLRKILPSLRAARDRRPAGVK